MNKYEAYLPLMNEWEYKFIEKYLNKDDIFFEWGAGNSTIYYAGIVKKVISLEHDVYWYDKIKKIIDVLEVPNIDFHLVEPTVRDQSIDRYEQLKDYVDFPMVNKIKFDKILIDGRARKHCAIKVWDYIDENVIIFIHDFNHDDVEGYDDPTYFSDILKLYDIVEFERRGRGIVALKKKVKPKPTLKQETT